ncbi:hypothetical protein RhiirC2_801873 [Rhizophagus irregularis]|uniref:Protein kinase domain-containing protein n=1 Tax=Rhizophagus irregularis TaxID=588596 RepID=A0A2N1M212_9GLOM|nr:hypothetical protein RhiirC2_801873 [Rhizophagus irregularis]
MLCLLHHEEIHSKNILVHQGSTIKLTDLDYQRGLNDRHYSKLFGIISYVNPKNK